MGVGPKVVLSDFEREAHGSGNLAKTSSFIDREEDSRALPKRQPNLWRSQKDPTFPFPFFLP